jgi:hypothetical protein
MMKRREFLLRSGAGVASAALPGFALPLNAAVEGESAHTEAREATVNLPMQRTIVHPGILQTRADLEFMRARVKAGEEPWKSAWDRLVAEPGALLAFKPEPFAHIIRGPYGAGQKGGTELVASANAANSHVLQWVVTGDEAHARKAIEIFDAWSETLVDFYENDAMLLAGWTGGDWANAAEILRATYPKWGGESLRQFKRMLLGVYVPLMRPYYPEANGNWDAAMMYSLLAIGIFCEDRQLIDQACAHYRIGPVNSGITHYVYPSGQCEETTRDQGHVQLGLGYMARTALVAWNQGIDLFCEADNRLALGYEYTAKLLLGEPVKAYGVIQDTKARLSDIYEGVLEHYKYVTQIEMPYAEKAALQVRDRSRSVLTLFKGAHTHAVGKLAPAPAASTIATAAGAQKKATAEVPAGAIAVAAGESIQAALDKLKTSGGAVSLGAGVHTLPATLKLPSNVTIAGTGLDCVLILAAEKDSHEAAIANAEPGLHDVVLRDFVIEGAQTAQQARDPNGDVQKRRTQRGPIRAGVLLLSEPGTTMKNLRFEQLTVRNCTFSGVSIGGAEGVEVVNCDFSANGGLTPPGPGKNHNLKLNHVARVTVSGSRLSDAMFGAGVEVSFGQQIAIRRCETARNALEGVRLAECRQVIVEGCLAEGNGAAGVGQLKWMEPNLGVVLHGNTLRNNVGY